jgi:cell division protein FtsB
MSKRAGLVLRILLLLVLVYMVFLFIRVRGQITSASAELEQLNDQVNQQLQTNTELSNAIENRDDPLYLKDIARERLGLVSKDDWVFYVTD